MDATAWLGLEKTSDSSRFTIVANKQVSVGPKFLFGGCALGAAICALETVTDRPLVWSTAQFLSFADTGSEMEIEVTPRITGHRTTQATAVGRVGDREIIHVNAALGTRSLDYSAQPLAMPEVQDPEICPDRLLRDIDMDTVYSRMMQRWGIPQSSDPADNVSVQLNPGRITMWVRFPELTQPGPAMLAVLADWVPMAASQVAGRELTGNSLDNTLRVFKIVPSDWFLIDLQIESVNNGFAHGTVHLWAQDGTLLGVGSQSATLRYR